MYRFLISAFAIALLLTSCYKNKDSKMNYIDQITIQKTTKGLIAKYGESQKEIIERGVNQVAAFWTEEDGSYKDFITFCTANFIAKPEDKERIFLKISDYFESLYGHFNKITLDFNKYLHLDLGKLEGIDELFGGYDVTAHAIDDFYKNKIAFYIILNFPNYSLKEKTELGEKWSRLDWAYARMGDVFTSRVPSEYLLKMAEVSTKSGTYIAEYNIYAGNLVDDKGNTYFPKDLKLLSHWNLRDELKSQYANPEGLVRQKMIYEVMKKIITQEIPEKVINNPELKWNPYKNVVIENGGEKEAKAEPNTRYMYLLNNFKVRKDIDKYCPYYSTYISRKFDQEFELPQKEVEELFTKLVSSPTVKKVAALIKQRLGRELQPFDIWYDGFKARSSMNEDMLTEKTSAKYPNSEAFEKDLANILMKLGFNGEKSSYIVSKIAVDAARGSGHAWGAQMKSEKAHLRTRIGKDGMNYKGYNIAIHEFGHNVEQTLTLNDVDYYMMNGVPNTAFTEAMAFVFQKRDLEILGINDNNPNKEYMMALDNFWSAYEIMGVALVDMQVWKWLYENPNANAEELKFQTIKIANEIWNKYYAGILGPKDQPILAIYSHMIENPLYLSAYPIGHLIELQVEKYLKGKDFAGELTRMLVQGKLIPQLWMKGAVGNRLSIEPTIEATEEALNMMK